MPIRCLWTFLLFFCLTFVFLSKATSQQVFDVEFSFEQDSISVKAGQTFANKISITNRTDKTIELVPFADETLSLSGLIKLPQRIILQAHEQKSFPLKYMADRAIIHKQVQAFSIGFIAADKSIHLPKPITFYSKLELDRTLILQTEQPEYYLDLSTNQLQLLLQASNMGLVPITFKLVFSGYPPGFVVNGDVMQMTLQPGAQTLLPFTANMRSKSSFQDFDFMMQGVDESGVVVATHRVRILRVGSVKRFGNFDDFRNTPYNNTVAFRYLSMGQGSSIYQLQGNGNLDLSTDKKLNYRLNFDYYQDQRALTAYDTYVDFQTKNWGLKIGNIYENLDQTISGRGVKASYKFNEGKSINLYGIENNYMLFSQLSHLIGGAKVLGASYAVQSNSTEGSLLSYLHSRDDYREVNSDQISGKTQVHIRTNQSLGVEGGYSLECTDQDQGKHALSLGVNYQYSADKYQITSMNYYSSPYYTGLRRGLTQSDSRVSKLFGNNQSIAARISYLDNNPKYQLGDKGYFFSNANRIQIYEVGYHIGLGQFQVDFRPYLMLQQAQYTGYSLVGGEVGNWFSNAVRSISDVSFFSSRHRFYIRSDYGYIYRNTSNKPMAPFHSLRVTGNYSNRYVGFNTFVQINPYYLNDLLASTSDAKYRIYSFGPSTQFQAFNGNLQAQLSSLYSYYGFSRSNNLSVNGNAKWRLGGNWSLTGDVFYTFIRSRGVVNFALEPSGLSASSFDNRQIRVGIEKSFAQFHKGKGHNLLLSFFDDLNNNAIQDDGESTPEGVVVKIDRHVASTDARGRIKFLNMVPGSYQLQVENSQGWVTHEPISIVLTKNQRLAIPLVKTRVLKGKIIVVTDKYLQSKPDLAGIRIHALDRRGNAFTTLSDENGQFNLFLPLGYYTISIPTEGMSFSIENPIQEVDLQAKGMVLLEDFRYKDSRRKVGIKRF